MEQHILDRLKKVADLVLAATATPGYYPEVESDGPDVALIKLRLVEGYFRKPPPAAESKPVAQALRAGLIKRGYQVKGAKPGQVRDGIVYYFTVWK